MPSLIYLLNGVSYLAVSIISFFVFFVWFKNRNVCSLGKVIGISGIFYLIPSLLNFLWFSS